MFRLFESVVENTAAVARRGSIDAPGDASESAVKRTHAAGVQRANSPGPGRASSPGPGARGKMTLEERLKSRFTVGEASPSTTPSTSARASPAPTAPVERPLSPHSIPLPSSPPLPEALSVLVAPTLSTSSETIVPHPEANIPLPHDEPEKMDEEVPSETPSMSHSEPGSELQLVPLSIKEPTREVPEPPSEVPEPEAEPEPITEVPEPVDESEPGPAVETVLPPPVTDAQDVDALQERLKLVEQRFSDVSTSFKRLQAEKIAADTLLREMTAVETFSDIEGLRDYLQNLSLKAEISQDEIKRLNGKLTRQEERIEELRDTHKLESASQSEQIEKLQKQHDELRAASSSKEGEAGATKADVARLTTELEQWKRTAKEEEEKRVKAISLLKTVRQKSVKAEKEKEDVIREKATLVQEVTGLREREAVSRDKDRSERENEKTERVRLLHEVEQEREKAITGLRSQFDREVIGLKERQEKEIVTLRGQFELEAVTSKGNYSKELGLRNSKIAALETSINSLSREKNDMFEQLQMRQAELESSQSRLETLESQLTETQYELREYNDRIGLLNEELLEARREASDMYSSGPSTSSEDVARLLSAAESKSEAKIMDLKRQITAVERERNDNEAEWSRKLKDKAREADELKRSMEGLARTRDSKDEVADELKKKIARLQAEIVIHQEQVQGMQLKAETLQDDDNATKMQILELEAKVAVLEQHCEEVKAKESQTRLHNKTLRDELRKVQSSAALLEKQRNPGVGYWTSRPEGNGTTPVEGRTSMSSSTSDSPVRAASPAPSAAAEEEVNLEYLRNVILQFLEHKEMRPNLVRVLSIILHFTPQETRRLVAKV